MYGKSIKCDMCDYQEMLPEWPEHTLGDEFPGWIRVGINQPIMYSFWRNDPLVKYSLLKDAFDCCSIRCAEKALYLAVDMIPKEQEAASE